MGRKRGAQLDLYRTDGRVAEQRREEARKRLPAWFRRVSILDITEHRNHRPEDFDVDISELGESDESSEEEEEEKEEAKCECDSDVSECDCGFADEEDDKGDDNPSEKTCDSMLSEAEQYYELKNDRKKRKRVLLEVEEKRKRTRQYEKEREEEVHAAYQTFKKARRQARKEGTTIPLDFIAPKEFTLFSLDHVNKLFHSTYESKRVNFYHMNEEDTYSSLEEWRRIHGEAKPLFADIRLDQDACCSVEPFPLPVRASSKDLQLKTYGEPDDKHDVRFKFFGNGYLKISISRDFVFGNGRASSATAPEMFEFFGIARDKKKEREDRIRRREEQEKNRPRAPPSPRDSFFERTHFMGSYTQW